MKLGNDSKNKSHTYNYKRPNCSPMSGETSNTAFWFDMTENSPLCGAEFDLIHFAKTTTVYYKT